MILTPESISNFQNLVFEFYKTNKRNLPWRNTTNPYYIFLSEIMLQQTQVDRVIPYYVSFLDKYPTIELLAQASAVDLLKMWRGLGYNSRILRFQKSCQKIVSEFNGIVPNEKTKLRSLPGIGPYTASAILAFAYNQDVVVIDTNVRRIILSHFQLPETTSVKDLEKVVLSVLPLGKSRDWYNALMDYGSIEVSAKKTGIKSLSTQTTFEGSTRQIRAGLIHYLVEHGSISMTDAKAKFVHSQFSIIISKLVKEELIEIKGDRIVFLLH